jgi:hypothetical protein
MAGAAATQADRAQGAILGSLVADTATMGLHWIYDLTKLQGLLQEHGRAASPCFFEPPSCPFYQARRLPRALAPSGWDAWGLGAPLSSAAPAQRPARRGAAG